MIELPIMDKHWPWLRVVTERGYGVLGKSVAEFWDGRRLERLTFAASWVEGENPQLGGKREGRSHDGI